MHKNRQRKLGVIHEDIAPVAASTEPSTHPAVLMPAGGFAQPILMQGESPECGGYALAWLIAYLKTVNVPLSGSFDYAYEKTVDGYATSDGTTISAIGKAGSTVGSCPDTEFPNDGNNAPNAPHTPFTAATPQAIKDAAGNVLGTAVPVSDLSINGIHQAISDYDAVILEVQLGDEWYTDISGVETWVPSSILPLRPPKKVIDSHFITAFAYDETKDETWFANSWSEKWGQKGYGYFNSNYAPYIQNATGFNFPNASVPTPAQLTLWQKIINILLEIIGIERSAQTTTS